MSIFYNGEKYSECSFVKEQELEDLVVKHSKILFGENTIYIDSKKKINTGNLGKTIPDGFLFDFSDIDNPKFYLVEIELAKHSFYNHIFPQITKFFAFLRDGNNFQAELINSLHREISADNNLDSNFKKFISKQELFKVLKDTIEDSRDILIVIDNEKKEFDEIKEIYTDTWDKCVKLVILKKFKKNGNYFLQTKPDFELIKDEIIDSSKETRQDESKKIYTEEFHLDGVKDHVKRVYHRIKESFPGIMLNCQKYYISMKHNHHFAYLKFRKSKIVITIMLPHNTVKEIIRNHFTKIPL